MKNMTTKKLKRENKIKLNTMSKITAVWNSGNGKKLIGQINFLLLEKSVMPSIHRSYDP